MRVKSVLIVVLVLLVTSVSFAQEPEAPKPDPSVALQAAQIVELKKTLASQQQQLAALAQRIPAPSAKARAKTQRQGYQDACSSQGLKFDGLEIDAKTGAIKVYCR